MSAVDTPEAVEAEETEEAVEARCDNAHRIMLSGVFYADAAASPPQYNNDQ